MFVLIRHGERSDVIHGEKEKVKNMADAPLTLNGRSEARKTGEFLLDLFQKKYPEIKHFIVVSSPFLRCVETADEISACLQRRFPIEQIYCEESVGEWYASHIYGPEDFKKLEIYKSAKCLPGEKNNGPFEMEKIRMKLSLNTFYKPEDRLSRFFDHSDLSSAYERMDKVFETTYGFLEENNDTCVIMVSHAFSINVLFKYYFRTHVDFCSTTVCKLGPNKKFQFQEPYLNYLQHIFYKPKL